MNNRISRENRENYLRLADTSGYVRIKLPNGKIRRGYIEKKNSSFLRGPDIHFYYLDGLQVLKFTFAANHLNHYLVIDSKERIAKERKETNDKIIKGLKKPKK